MRLALALILALLALPASAAAETRIVVGRDPGLTAAERADIRADAGVEHVETLRIPDTEVVEAGDADAALARLRRDPDVRYAAIDPVWHALAPDPDRPNLWAIENPGNVFSVYGVPAGVADADMDVPEAWLTSTGDGVTVAVVDSGVDEAHPDLAGQISGRRNFLTTGAVTDVSDGNGHGTHVTGTIAAVADNGVGVVGIAPDADVVSLRALNSTGSGSLSAIANAFDYAGDLGIRIVNASLGGSSTLPAMSEAISAHPNTLYVVAAGNGGSDDVGDDNDAAPTYPCALELANVLCVGASTMADGRASFSNFGLRSVDLFAPGEYIESTVPVGTGGFGPDYDVLDGTSMASPAVAAEAALILQAAPPLTAAQVRGILMQSGDAVPAFSGKSVSGRRANAARAVELAGAAPPADDDADGVPNSLDATPRGGDGDGDGVPALDDRCPALSGPGTGDGCPVALPTPPTPPTPPDGDGDGIADAGDACPAEAARTRTGCRVPAVRSLTVRVARRSRRATARVRADRAATAVIRIDRRSCRGRHCRWVRVATRTVVTRENAAALVRRLARGSYRVSATLSSASGSAPPVRRTFRVR